MIYLTLHCRCQNTVFIVKVGAGGDISNTALSLQEHSVLEGGGGCLVYLTLHCTVFIVNWGGGGIPITALSLPEHTVFIVNVLTVRGKVTRQCK